MTTKSDITLTRIYDSPVKSVWEAWTDPAKVAQWWGPRGFTITTHSKDLRAGGTWVYTMHGPDGTNYENKTLYLEVDPLKRLVYDHGGNDDRPPLFRVTVLFSEHAGKTTMEMTMRCASPQAAEETKKFIKQASGESTWDRLAEHLASPRPTFVINRSFETSIDHMWQMWTDPSHFARWLPPKGFEMEFKRVEIKEGGGAFYAMHGAGVTMYGRVAYLELRRPDRLVYTQQFCDEHEQLSRHPGAPVWPATMRTTVTLNAEDANRTRVTVLWQPEGDVTEAEVSAFLSQRAGMTQGWTGSFDKLEALLR